MVVVPNLVGLMSLVLFLLTLRQADSLCLFVFAEIVGVLINLDRFK